MSRGKRPDNYNGFMNYRRNLMAVDTYSLTLEGRLMDAIRKLPISYECDEDGKEFCDHVPKSVTILIEGHDEDLEFIGYCRKIGFKVIYTPEVESLYIGWAESVLGIANDENVNLIDPKYEYFFKNGKGYYRAFITLDEFTPKAVTNFILARQNYEKCLNSSVCTAIWDKIHRSIKSDKCMFGYSDVGIDDTKDASLYIKWLLMQGFNVTEWDKDLIVSW